MESDSESVVVFLALALKDVQKKAIKELQGAT